MVMILNSHAKCVDEDTEEDPLLEDTVVHDGVQTTPDPTQESADTLQTGRETPENVIIGWSSNSICTNLTTGFFFVGVITLRSLYRW